jgi:molybdate transport system substrate-binding protein
MLRRRTSRSHASGVALGVVAGLAVAGLVGCGSDGTTANESGSLVVFAAASLTDAFGEIADEFVGANPGTDVTLNLGGSSDLVAQIVEGAPADVFAAADLTTMDRLVQSGEVSGDAIVFATNRAQIIVAPGNPEGISGVADLARDDLIVLQCAVEVPCGRYAQEIQDRAGVTSRPQSFEENVRSVATKVVLGEADAGIVYATDVKAAGGDAAGVEIAAAHNVVAEYPIAVTAATSNRPGADAFVQFVTGPQGRRILMSYGFGTP